MVTKTIKRDPKTVYNVVHDFCDENGYLAQLEKSLSTSEAERFNKLTISKQGLDILDAVHCVEDKKRSIMLLSEIDRMIKPGMRVLEAGIGSGLLSFGAATKDAQVTGLEINKHILGFAKKVQVYSAKKLGFGKEQIAFKSANAITYDYEGKCDAIISENLYTGMFYEKQVEIMNHLVRFLKKGGVTIPSGIISGVALAQTVFPHTPKQQELFVPLQLGKTITTKVLTESIVYSNLDFSKKNTLSINTKLVLPIEKSGTVNSLLVWSEVLLPSGGVIKRKDTIFLNNDIVIALEKPTIVEKGQKVQLHMKYTYGSKPSEASFTLKII